MSETDFREMLADALFETRDEDLQSLASFEEDGILTSNEGLVVTLNDGSQFQVTIVKSR